MGIEIKSLGAGTQLHLTFSPDETSWDEVVTFHVFTRDSIDVQIRKNGHISSQVFIDVDDLLRAADLIRDMRKELKRS